MGHIQCIIAAAAIFTVSSADMLTLSLGDSAQYSASLVRRHPPIMICVSGLTKEEVATPTLTGSSLLFTKAANPNDGLDVILSEDLRASVQKAVDNDCKDTNTQCVQSIKSLLVNQNTKLESRQLGSGLVARAALAEFLSILFANAGKGQNAQPIPAALHVPSSQIDPAISAARAGTFAAVTKSDAPAITIMPTPAASTITTANRASYTFLSNTQDGRSPGDLAITLDEELAKMISNDISESQHCDSTDQSGPPPLGGIANKDVNAQAGVANVVDKNGEITCAARQLVENGAGYVKDFAALSIKQPDWVSPDMMHAMLAHVSWVWQWKDSLGLTPLESTSIAFWAFMVSYYQITGNAPLSRLNWTSGNDLKWNGAEFMLPSMITVSPTMTITASGSTSSSSVLECPASCTHVGVIRDCETWCATPTGDQYYYDRPSTPIVKTVAIEPWRVPKQLPIVRPVSQAPVAVCPPQPGNATDFPTDLFGSVYSKFCKESGTSTESATTTVNWKGDKNTSLRSRLLRFMTRDDASDDAKFKDYKFTLGRVPRNNAGSTCSVPCDLAFQQFSSQDLCKRGDDKKTMANQGVLDAGCAMYTFSIDVLQQKVEVTCRDANGPYSAPKYDRSASGATGIETAIKDWCSDSGLKQLIKDGATPYGRWPITQINVPNRSSFWLRAQVHGNNNIGIILYDQCVSVFTEGLNKRDTDSDMTHGFSALLGSLEYSIDVSGWTQEGNPPWDQKVFFPPADSVKGKDGKSFASECYPNISPV